LNPPIDRLSRVFYGFPSSSRQTVG
jgi:hypothetical protein